MRVGEPRRFFLVPSGESMPAGDDELSDLQLVVRKVDLAAMEDFEVDLATAQAHVDAGWGRVLGTVRDALRQLTGKPATDEPPDLSTWIGVTPGQVALDPQARRAGRRTLLARAGELLGHDVSEERLDEAEARIDDFIDNAPRPADAAAAVGESLRDGAERIREAFVARTGGDRQQREGEE